MNQPTITLTITPDLTEIKKFAHAFADWIDEYANEQDKNTTQAQTHTEDE
ncbi:hypothetical protein [Gardnerella swidsinskii]|jgi:hypothetical protein|nr:hypothetical protein [uncultured Gardnerella sp.]